MTLGRSTAVTDAGRRRRRNEDVYVCEPPLFAVADGMGGAQAGEVASRLAAATLRQPSGDGPPSGRARVVALVEEANRRVYKRASEDEAVSGMGTTLTVALVEDSGVTIGHVGDSRVYLIRDGALEQLTEDHSLVAELVRSGKLTPAEAEVHPQRSVITRALGTDPEVEIDSFAVPTRAGDLFMLCSDGLTSMIDDRAILGLVERHRTDLEATARALVDEANAGGGEDNITVVLFEIAPEPAESENGEPTAEAAAEEAEITLTEADLVPVLKTATAAPERDGEAAPTRHRRWRIPRSVLLAGTAAVLAGLAGLALFGLSRSHFVGAQPNGHVAVYQGVPWNLIGHIRLYRVRYESPLLAGQLSRAERKRLFDHSLESYSSAVRSVRAFERQVVP